MQNTGGVIAALTYGQERLRDSPLTPLMEQFRLNHSGKGSKVHERVCTDSQVSNIPITTDGNQPTVD